VARLRTFIAAAFAAAGLSGADAHVLGELIAEADLHGTDTHGVFRMPLYVRRIKAGGINRHPAVRPAMSAFRLTRNSLSSPGSTGRSSKHRP
jgi:L-2-hydroxycarboxylate dehydrogenase (NAD+)